MTTSDTGGSDTVGYNLTTSATPSYNGSSLTASQGNTSGITWYGYVKDTAGNVSSCNSESFKVDTTAPNISFSFSGSTSTVTCSDSDSGDSYVTRNYVDELINQLREELKIYTQS